MSKIRRWCWTLLAVLAIVPLASCGVMQTPEARKPDPIVQLATPQIVPPVLPEKTIVTIPTPVPASTAPSEIKPIPVAVAEPEVSRDDRLVTGLVDRFKKPEELMRRIVAAATRLARPDFPKRNDILAIIAVESSFNPRAVHRGSKGLMQIQLSAHPEKVKGKHTYDVDDNITMGAQILEDYYVQLDRNRRAAVLAYNAGIGNYLKRRFVEKYYRKYLTYLKFVNSISD